MELRHLRCFVALAEELHFGRAADKLHMDQSPLSRIIKELEDSLRAQLFYRDRRGTRLTHAGEVFLQEVRRIFFTLEQAKDGVKAAASGSYGLLRIALSDRAAQPRLATLLALCREEEPGVAIRLTEVSIAEHLRGLRGGAFDAGFARTPEVGDGIDVYPIWRDPFVAVMPSRHPLLAHSEVALDDLVRYPLILCDQDVCEGYRRQIEVVLAMATGQPQVAELATSLEMMLTLVAAGYGVGFSTAERITSFRHPDTVARPLAVEKATSITYLLVKKTSSVSERLNAFVSRALRGADDPEANP